VTTEDDFQAAIDANPEDWQTRLVFADWLQERADPRADGYRTLGVLRRRAMACQMTDGPLRFIFGTAALRTQVHRAKWGDCLLPKEWFRVVAVSTACNTRATLWKYYVSRREAEDAAALALATFTVRRRANLLKRATGA
jgi:uncharacterized protein (TIGR02996 family)